MSGGRMIYERDVLREAGELARVSPKEYGRLVAILGQCETVSPEGLRRSEETIDQKIKRVVAEELAAFTLPNGKRPRDVRLVVRYDQMDAYISLRIPGEEQEDE